MTSAAPRRRLLLAAPRGFCAGVERAIAAVERALEEYGTPIYVRKEIVHNKFVVNELRSRGVVFVDELDEVPTGSVVVFSAHGVSPTVRADAVDRHLHAIDATCPLVAKVHNEVQQYAAAGYQIFLIGHKGHEEVEGTLGEAPDHVTVIDTPADAANAAAPGGTGKSVWLSQTTLSVDDALLRVADLRRSVNAVEDPPSSDICYATSNRQTAVRQIAPECDLVLIVGSANSSNSVRLTEVAKSAGARSAHLIDNHTELDPLWLADVETIGISAGASVPEHLVQQVIALVQSRGWPEPEIVVTSRETQVFALPRTPVRAFHHTDSDVSVP